MIAELEIAVLFLLEHLHPIGKIERQRLRPLPVETTARRKGGVGLPCRSQV